MIGQANIIHELWTLANNNSIPSFMVLTGSKGSGKKTLVKEFCDYCKHVDSDISCVQIPNVKIETLREMIKCSYKLKEPTIYVIPDADDMSQAAKNSILKVTEEPPNNAHFIMTLEDKNNMLPTILSRAAKFQMEPYSLNDLMLYAEKNTTQKSLSEGDISIIKKVCMTPGDFELLDMFGIAEFYGYVEKVADNVYDISTANALKINEKLALKEGQEAYDVRLFLVAFIAVCSERMFTDTEDFDLYGQWIMITSEALKQLGIRGINKTMLMAEWILKIRRV